MKARQTLICWILALFNARCSGQNMVRHGRYPVLFHLQWMKPQKYGDPFAGAPSYFTYSGSARKVSSNWCWFVATASTYYEQPARESICWIPSQRVLSTSTHSTHDMRKASCKALLWMDKILHQSVIRWFVPDDALTKRESLLMSAVLRLNPK